MDQPEIGKQHIVIFSHGFGVQKDSRGLFIELSDMLSNRGIQSVLFDYNEIRLGTNEVVVKPFSEQAKILQQVIEETRAKSPDSVIDIIAHSQGTVMVALAKPVGIRRVISMSPFFHTDIHRVTERYKRFPASEFNVNGISRRVRSDGTTTVIQPEYWAERFATDVYQLYNDLALTTSMTIVNAGEDEVIDQTNLSHIFNAYILNIHGDHDFTGESRKPLIKIVEDIITRD